MKNSYEKLSTSEKQKVINELYTIQNMSFADIAKEYDTYSNKVRRDAVKFGVSIRNKSEAQKNALSTGKHKHPTKGTQRSTDIKEKIGLSVLQSWENLPESEISRRKEQSRKAWENMSQDTKENIQQEAIIAVRKASKTGSKLEKYIFEQLLKNGYKTEIHKEQILSNTKLQIDLFLPTMNVAIEVDGPSHFLPIWGEDTLLKNQKYDAKKNGLILGKGLVLIRIKQLNDYSKTRASLIYAKLKSILDQVQNKFPEHEDRLFTIED